MKFFVLVGTRFLVALLAAAIDTPVVTASVKFKPKRTNDAEAFLTLLFQNCLTTQATIWFLMGRKLIFTERLSLSGLRRHCQILCYCVLILRRTRSDRVGTSYLDPCLQPPKLQDGHRTVQAFSLFSEPSFCAWILTL